MKHRTMLEHMHNYSNGHTYLPGLEMDDFTHAGGCTSAFIAPTEQSGYDERERCDALCDTRARKIGLQH